MINISKSGNAIKFAFTDSDHYLYGNGEIEVPVNSLSLIVDESNMVTFRKANSNDIFLSFNPANSNLSDKEGVINFYKTNMVGSTGGGSESGITSGEVQTMIDESLEDYYDKDEVDTAFETVNASLSGKADTSAVTAVNNALTAHTSDTTIHVTSADKTAWNGKADTSAVTAVANDVQTVSGQVATKVNTTDFNAYSAATDARIAEDEEVTAAALNNLDENKQDALEFYSEAETEDSETGEIDKYGQIEVADELNGAHIYADYLSTNDEKNPYASIDAWVNDGEGNEKQNRVYAEADGVQIWADENADDGEGNIVYRAANVSVTSTEIGMSVSEDVGNTATTLSITPTGVTINDEAVATESYVDAATSGKADTSAVTAVNDALTAHTSDTDIHVTTAQTAAWNAKAEPYSAGTGIEISGNVISATGGGGATYSAGTNISIDTGNTINCTLNLNNGSGANSIVGNSSTALGKKSFAFAGGEAGTGSSVDTCFAFGYACKAKKNRTFAFGSTNNINEINSVAFGTNITLNSPFSFAAGGNITSSGWYNTAFGEYTRTNNRNEFGCGVYNNSVTGSTASGQTLFSVGNGTADNARHNAFEVRQNGDIYVNDGTNDVRLQDTILALGGLKLVKLTQSEYDQLATKDPDTLYIITNVVS